MSDHSSLASTDIMLLMENYQNIMQMSTIVQQQQNQLITLQNKLVVKQDTISQRQDDAIRELTTITDKIKECSDNLAKTNESIKACCKTMEDVMGAKIDLVKTDIDDWKVDVVKQHGTINRNVYIAWGTMATIVLGVIALLVTAYEKFALLDKMNEILIQLVQYFHLS